MLNDPLTPPRHQKRATLPMVELLVFDFGTRVRAKGADIVFWTKQRANVFAVRSGVIAECGF